MSDNARPLVISAPDPRTLDLIFTKPALRRLRDGYRIVETDPDRIATLPQEQLAEARYIVGQPPLSRDTIQRMQSLRCIFNVETNLLSNMPYDLLFERGIHVVTTGAVFAEPVAELGLAMALNLARDIVDADLAFRNGAELWGGDGNQTRAAAVGIRDRHHRLRRSRPGAEPAARRLSRDDPRLRSMAAAVDPRRQRCRAGKPRRGAFDQRLRLRRRRGDQREPGLSRRRRLRQNAQGRRLHPAQPRRRRRFPGADAGGPQRPHRRRQRRLSRGASGARSPGPLASRASCARPTAPGPSTSPSSAWATWCWKTWT